MTDEVAEKDETEGFVVTSSDMPDTTPEPQDAQQQKEADASSADSTEGKETQSSKQDEPGNDTSADRPEKKQNGVQKRIDKVIREREEARREKEALQRQIDELKGKKPESENDKEPVESDYETYDEYLDAVEAYENNQGDNKGAKADPDRADTEESNSELNDSQKTALAVIKEAVDSAEVPDDFEQIALNPDVPITGEMLEALAECDDPTAVMYHLGQNKEEAAEIAAGSAAQQMRAIAKLDMKVEGGAPPKPTKTTTAPDPIKPVNGTTSQQKSVSEMSFSEYEKAMNKREKERSSW